MSNEYLEVDGRKIPVSEIAGRECKFALYATANDGSQDDAVFIKEQLHLKSGERIPRVTLWENFEREFFVTKPGFRNHKDKKMFELASRVDRFKSTQSKLRFNIVQALGSGNANLPLRQILDSPYVYGCDSTTPVVIKHMFMEKYPDAISSNTVAALDIETDVVHGNGDTPIMISVSFGVEKLVYAVKSFYGTRQNVIERFRQRTFELIGTYIEKWEKNVDFQIFDTPFECIQAAFKQLHIWKPDFVSIWNIKFDLPKIIACIEKAGWDLATVFSDPSVPLKYRHAEWKPGRESKPTASKKESPIHTADQWHVMRCFSSFYFIDAMCVYKRIRVTGGNERGGYGLDSVLNKILGIRKLKFKEADHLAGLEWHQFLQANYPVEYSVYNLFDTVSMEELDAKTRDLSQTVSLLCGHSEYSRFTSTPRRLADDLEFFAKEKGYVFGTTGSKMGKDPLDVHVVGMHDWIITLPAHLMVDGGIRCIKDLPSLPTRIYTHTAD